MPVAPKRYSHAASKRKALHVAAGAAQALEHHERLLGERLYEHDAKLAVLKRNANDLHDFASKLAGHTPEHQHIVNDTTFTKTVAKRQLINYKWFEAFHAETTDMHKYITSFSRTKREWAVAVVLDADEECSSNLKSVKDKSEAARVARRVRKGCKIVLDMSGQEQADEAKAHVTNFPDLPKMLVSALNQCVRTRGGTAAKSSMPFGKKRKADEMEALEDS